MDLLKSMRSDFENYLQSYLDDLPERPAKLYDAIKHILSSPGKRLRPLAALLGYYVFDNDYKRALPAALAIEIFHNFTLVHDDIMDRAEMRRGQASVHVKYGTDTAIMVGDVMMIHSIRALLLLDEEVNLDLVLDHFTSTSSGICEGQIFDMEFEKRKDVNSKEYLEMVGLKTAVLLGLSFQSGALIAGVEEDQAEPLFEFGYAIGLAFQIIDDWIDAFGDSSQTGKVRGGDIKQKKKTLLWIIAMENAEEEDKAYLENVMREEAITDRQIERVLQLYHLYDVSGIALQYADDILAGAKEKITNSDIAKDKAELLFKIADDLVKRMK
ncbi:MAG: polyprenyl synthetase family protein [Saprospirales bacterium]|nr:MAG: polyprenyl synthetase family protein [Saprospirales bacterium]